MSNWRGRPGLRPGDRSMSRLISRSGRELLPGCLALLGFLSLSSPSVLAAPRESLPPRFDPTETARQTDRHRALAEKARSIRLGLALEKKSSSARLILPDSAVSRLPETRLGRRELPGPDPVLVEKCQENEVQDLLRPFLELGVWQPVRYRRGELRLGVPQPISLERLHRIGALEKTPRGRRVLDWVAVNGKDELRFRWPYRTRAWHHEVEFLTRVQDLLLELGPTLVSLGYLSE